LNASRESDGLHNQDFHRGSFRLYSGWLIGIQSEVSRNLSNTRLTGTAASAGRSTTTTTGTLFGAGFTTSASTGVFETNLRNEWTVSEMAKIGFLANRDWLVYGLVGWSVAGFDLGDNPVRPFTLDGITYGAGVERDFGWLRAFVQFKAIDYWSKDIVTSNASTTNFTLGGLLAQVPHRFKPARPVERMFAGFLPT
jgi:hypothetical protein